METPRLTAHCSVKFHNHGMFMIGKYTETNKSFLIADLAGYTSLTETHGNISAVNVVSRYLEIVNMSLKDQVYLLERVGDEVLIISESPVQLLETALALVQNINKEPEFLSIHIGIHTGDVIEHNGKYYGSALNLCSRIASYSNGGQILCSREVVQEVADREKYRFDKIGDVQLKNVSKLVSVYELRSDLSSKKISIDPVCKMQVDHLNPPAKTLYQNSTYSFCSSECLEKFFQNPDQYTYHNRTVASRGGDHVS